MLLVSDSCFSGALATRSAYDVWKKKGIQQYKNLHRQPSYQVLTSAATQTRRSSIQSMVATAPSLSDS
jgi:hypothetical protein